VAYGLKLRKMTKEHIKRTVEATLERVGLSHIAERKVANLSGGEVQRVAIARALAINPGVFFLDEPTANVDQMNIKLIEEIILGLRKKNKSTVVMTTHNPTQAYLLADTVFSIIDKSVTETYYENIFQGEIKAADGTKVFTKNNIQIRLVSDKTGRAIISVDPREIIISSAPLDSSARNSFNGKVIKISELKAQIKVVVDIGLDFAVIITKESCAEMGLTIGSQVFVTFKSSSVQVY